MDLTPRQRSLLGYIGQFIEENGYPPSYREMARDLSFRSTNGVAHQLRVLERKGLVMRDGLAGSARSLRLAEAAGEVLGLERRVAARKVPVVGRVAAGQPVSEELVEDGSIAVDETLLPRGDSIFALRVRGDSMVEDGILDGDLVMVRSQETAREEDVVVALLDGEATVKRLRRRQGRLWLDPANREMEPIPLLPDQEARLLGVVVGLFRKMS